MRHLRMVREGEDARRLSGAVLFGILWDELSDLLGTAATAAVLRRAIRRALDRHRELDELVIDRVDREYGYVLPRSFEQSRGPPAALCDLLDELRPLLEELTGEVALRQLDRVPQLRSWPAHGPRPA